MSSINNNDLDDDLMMFTMGKIFLFFNFIFCNSNIYLDPLNNFDDEDESHRKSDLSTSDYHSFVATTDTSLMVDSSPVEIINKNKKMFDITELLGSSSFDDKQEICNWFEKLQPISTSSPSLCVVNYLHAQALDHDQDIQWQMEQNHLKYGKRKTKFSKSFFFNLFRLKTIIPK
jgi:hypothetical protein